MTDLLSRYRGSLMGLAVGDALGTTLEFSRPGSFAPLRDMVGGGPFRLQPGQWTDDTSMAICLAESLVERAGFDAADQMQRYLRWYREGYHSSTGRCFDIGNTVRAALEHFARTGNAFAGPTAPDTAGNGSMMRLAPVPLFYARAPHLAITMAADSSRTTHGATEAIDACRYLAGLILGALMGHAKDLLLGGVFEPMPGIWQETPLSPRVAAVAAGSYRDKRPADIRGSGYVVESLEAALWAFRCSDSFADGALLAVNLGDDADTTGAVYGQLAGAYYGLDGIPAAWRAAVSDAPLILSLADRLFDCASRVMLEP